MAITTEQLIAQAKEAADLTNVADYVTTAQWIAWLNDGVRELHRFVTNKFKATYYRTYDFTLAEGESQITLPAAFWRLKGLDIDPDTPKRREVLPYNFADRNKLTGHTLRDLNTFAHDRRYNLLGSAKLKIQAEEHAYGNYRLYYVPKPRVLAAARSITRDPGDDLVQADGGPDGTPLWTFDSATFLATDVGYFLSIDGADEPENDGIREITALQGENALVTDGTAVNETLAADATASLVMCLDPELEPYSEYVWLCAAIKSLVKEESFAQARELKEQRALIRADLAESLETDQGGPQTILDTDDEQGDW